MAADTGTARATAQLRRVVRAVLWLAIVAALAWLARSAAPLVASRWPERWNPWAPLDPLAEPNALTGFKVTRAVADAPACRAALDRTTLEWRPEPDRPVRAGCGWRDAVRVGATPARLSSPTVLSCRAALSLAMWERHRLQPAALAALGSAVTRIEHFGSFACRDIGGGSGGRRSRHASADALDVAGFVLADGRTVRVLADWPRDDAKGRFLQDVHAGACRHFGVVLGPDHDAAHRNHFHLDVGGGRLCR